jgi:hypothetical protein
MNTILTRIVRLSLFFPNTQLIVDGVSTPQLAAQLFQPAAANHTGIFPSFRWSSFGQYTHLLDQQEILFETEKKIISS